MKLKESLLFEIYNPNSFNKYSKSFYNIVNIFKLEENTNFKFKDSQLEEFKTIKDLFSNIKNNVPLLVLEQFYLESEKSLNGYISIRYQGTHTLNLSVMVAYELLENFYNKIFSLACSIGDLYNLEIKINANSQKNKDDKNEYL